MLVLAVHYGTGSHNADVTSENVIEAVKVRLKRYAAYCEMLLTRVL